MPRRKKVVQVAESEVTRNGIYTSAQVRARMGVHVKCIRLAIKSGKLRYAKRGQRYLFLGEWLWEWVQIGEVRRSPVDTSPSTN